MPNSYEYSFQHNLDDVIDASDAVLAIGTEKVDTTTLKDRSLNNNNATIHEAMPSSGYFLGRTFDGDDDYLDCGNSSYLNSLYGSVKILFMLNNNNAVRYVLSSSDDDTVNYFISPIRIDDSNVLSLFLRNGVGTDIKIFGNTTIYNNVWYCAECISNGSTYSLYINGREETLTVIDGSNTGLWFGDMQNLDNVMAGILKRTTFSNPYDGIIGYLIINNENNPHTTTFFNTLARLPLYSHNFERYPNSDTSLTSVFPYTSGIITSGSFNKTDGLKCTSAGQIIFSNSFEFDGSEYITLIINGVEYSGTTTVTQGTITATIAQGSNDITIDMGTGDVLPDIRVQFREEV